MALLHRRRLTDALLATNTHENAPWCSAFMSHHCPRNTHKKLLDLTHPDAASGYKKHPRCYGFPVLPPACVHLWHHFVLWCPLQILLPLFFCIPSWPHECSTVFYLALSHDSCLMFCLTRSDSIFLGFCMPLTQVSTDFNWIQLWEVLMYLTSLLRFFPPQMSFHASQESRGFVARSKGEYQLVGLGRRQDQQDMQTLQLAWPGDSCRRPEERA
jgi:hypothetical protein